MNTDGTLPTDDETERLAGEYVLGTLEAAERRQVERRLLTDASLRAAMARWEARLQPLAERVTPVEPSANLWPRIERSLGEADAKATIRRESLWQRLALWQGLSAAGLAASLVLAVLLLMRPVPTPSYLVVLAAPSDRTPGWVIQTASAHDLQLIPLGRDAVPSGKTLQFWTKADAWQGPVSLGLVQPGRTLQVPLDRLPPLEANQLFELTLEDQGGSPTGRPTGPIQFIGRAVKVL
ncbi:RNA polymerase subunit sigma-70 [Pseudomonas oryzihabitans]|uniref:anti-sigma factor n=1 Tax=Pseudomonas rhizoryzae TaxID=2571129 RepID=UPI000736CEB5|nr:anti-sigma factor [Pseudomonas rhizoryzae]KTS72737.1 RNA polymerase subunit sigma-70 [Pseudomonas psychrotolerans]KTS96191.1 RNA polymerase subunit sigma-70 [Pseudomonas psychrotolerans]KTT23859.1 RNA polymerase subunit sigma-70 [Pseudomonas psychrotolerans]KTT28819.1 RNA polymerase subunit sigma-70 [Pseudomonas psychrotolerans]KTT31977.1 RNA polymerase subunit sigma-70 [Pseudomonas psychrotolerans]